MEDRLTNSPATRGMPTQTGVVTKDPNKDLFDAYAENYDETLATSTRWVSKDTTYFAEHKVKQIKHHLGFAPHRVLDYGCGIGRNIPFLVNHFPDAACFGCDISERSLEVARARNPGASFFLNEQRDRSLRFDLILVANVFHHVVPGDRPQVVDELRELLLPEGALFVFEHNPLNPLTRHSVKHCPFDRDAQLVGPRRLTRIFLGQGCRLRRRKYTLFFPQWLARFGGLEPLLGWLPLGAQYFIQVERG